MVSLVVGLGSEKLVIVLCGAIIGGHCSWPQCFGPLTLQSVKDR